MSPPATPTAGGDTSATDTSATDTSATDTSHPTEHRSPA